LNKNLQILLDLLLANILREYLWSERLFNFVIFLPGIRAYQAIVFIHKI
jgi:hypothetical protein